jgi:hypothetical protein
LGATYPSPKESWLYRTEFALGSALKSGSHVRSSLSEQVSKYELMLQRQVGLKRAPMLRRGSPPRRLPVEQADLPQLCRNRQKSGQTSNLAPAAHAERERDWLVMEA